MNQDYEALLSKVDAKVDQIVERHSSRIRCQKGCHQCCLPQISVSRIEAVSIGDFLNHRPEIIEKLKHVALNDPHKGRRCRFLDEDGACLIYEARPIICRTHGLPVRVVSPTEQGKTLESACHLNFEDGLEHVDRDSWINLDLVNSLLALINAHTFPGDAERYILDLQGLTPFLENPTS